MVLLALTLLLSYPHARLTGIEGMMKIVIFIFWILLQVAYIYFMFGYLVFFLDFLPVSFMKSMFFYFNWLHSGLR